jgi:acylphosphatase
MVGFRMFAEQQGASRDLLGWVRNCSDGSVEVMVEGPEAEVEHFLSALRRGPAAARVGSFEVTEAESGGRLELFRAVG